MSETDKAWMINDGADDIWIAKSQCSLRKISGDDYEFTIPSWLAKKKGIIDG